MASLEHLTFLWASLACLALTTTSAVVPWVNAEIIVLSLPTVADSRGELLALVLIATAGQMVGKCGVYWAGRKGAARPSPRIASALERWRSRLDARPRAAFGLVFVSSTVGVPPFYVTSLASGAMRLSFSRFLIWGTAGRLVRFGSLVMVPLYWLT